MCMCVNGIIFFSVSMILHFFFFILLVPSMKPLMYREINNDLFVQSEFDFFLFQDESRLVSIVFIV